LNEILSEPSEEGLSRAPFSSGTKGTAAGAHTQRARILSLLLDAHGGEIPLTEILALGIAQYNARIFELRRTGFDIRNRVEEIDGVRQSWYWLIRGERASKPDAPRPAPQFSSPRELKSVRAYLPLFDGLEA